MSDEQRLRSAIDAWEEACSSMLALGHELGEDDWATQTDLPGWTVADVFGHTAHLEATLTGAAHDDVELPDSPHVKGPVNTWIEQGVHARRGRAALAVLEEIDGAVARRAAHLRENPPTDGSARADGGLGEWDWNTLLSNRVVDVWMHEQDVRRAVGRPGGFSGAAPAHVVRTFLGAMPFVLGKRAGLEAGRSVLLTLTDADISLTYTAGADGRVSLTEEPPADPTLGPTLGLAMDTETFIVLCGGRQAPRDQQVAVTGDHALADRVLTSMAVTP